MVLDTLARWILLIVDWGRGIIVFLIAVEIFKGFRGSSAERGLASGAKSAWKGLEARVPGTARYAKRAFKQGINQYLMEEKEEKLLDDVKHGAKDLAASLEGVASQGQFASHKEMVNLRSGVREFGKKISELKRAFSNLSRSTNREYTRINKLIEYCKKKQVQFPQQVRLYEEQILKLHQATGEELAGLEGSFKKMMDTDAMKKLESLELKHFNDDANRIPYKIDAKSEPFNASHLLTLIKYFRNDKFILEQAYKNEVEAKKLIQSILAEARNA